MRTKRTTMKNGTKALLLWVLMAIGTHVFALPPIVETNGIPNGCVQCVWRRCAVWDGTTLKPVFFERKAGRLELEIAVSLAISYSRHGIADGVTFPPVHHVPPTVDALALHPLPYSINGISLTNMAVRTFAFATHPALATNDLNVVLVSFYEETISPGKFIYALYVNDNAGDVSDTIQGCSGYMGFLSNAMRHPFLDEAECERQGRFFSVINERRYGREKKVCPYSPLSPTRSKVIEDKDVEVEIVDH